MPAPLELDVVVGRQPIDASDVVAVCEQALCEVETDESGAAGDEDAQGGKRS
jgi:hypothetical protein